MIKRENPIGKTKVKRFFLEKYFLICNNVKKYIKRGF